jgi:hypothetical protein
MNKFLRLSLLLLIAAASTLATSGSQEPAPPDLTSQVPAAKPADVDSIDHIMAAIYDVISGPPGERDWNRFRSLFAPGARLTSTAKPPKPDPAEPPVRLFTAEDYVNLAGKYFLANGFFESAIVNKVQRFGNIAQVFSSYESRHTAADAKPFTRGINSMQLFYDGKRWYVLSILWDEESASNPLPAEMAKRSASPATQN